MPTMTQKEFEDYNRRQEEWNRTHPQPQYKAPIGDIYNDPLNQQRISPWQMPIPATAGGAQPPIDMPPYLINPQDPRYTGKHPALPAYSYRPPGFTAPNGTMWDSQPPTAGGAQPPLPWQGSGGKYSNSRQPGMGFGVIDNPNWFQQQPQQPGFEDRARPWQNTPQMSFNLRPPMAMQPNWRQAWNYQQQPQQQLPSQQAPLRTSVLSSYDWTS